MFKMLKELLSLLTDKQRKKLIFIQLLVTITAIVEIVSVVSVAPFIALVSDISILEGNNVLGQLYQVTNLSDPYDFIMLLGAGVLVLMTLGCFVSIFTTWRLSLFAHTTGIEIGNTLYQLYLRKSWSFHSRTNSAILTKKTATESARVTTLILTPLMQMNSKIVLVFLMLLGMFFINPLIAVVGSLIFGVSYFFIYSYTKSRLSSNGLLVSKENTKRFKLMSEGFGGVKDLILLGKQGSFIQQFEESGSVLSISQGTNDALALAPRYLMELVAFGSVVVLLLFLINSHNGSISEILPVLTVYALAGFKILPAFQQIYYNLSRIKGNLSAFQVLREDLYEARDLVIDTHGEDAFPSLHFKRSLEIKNMSYSYSASSDLVLNELSLTIPVNSTVGFVGTTGAGKSTLIDIILGLITPNQGSILIDDVPLSKKTLRAWQNKIGYVPQSIFLTDGSITENIAFGVKPELIDKARVDLACELSCVDEFVVNMSKGLLTTVGERGVQLSGGQRQRIGLARALYNDIDVLVLDEATSALDGTTEKKIVQAIKKLKGHKTILMIAHRLSTVRDCDIIFFMEKGGIAHSGTYEELIEKSSEFKAMAQAS